MSKKLGIFGAGELGIQITNYAIKDGHYSNIVFFDDVYTQNHILGNSEDIISAFDKDIFDELVISIGYNFLDLREDFLRNFKNKVPLGRIIHTSCWFDDTAIMAPSCAIYPNCTIDKQVQIKENTILNLNCTITHNSIIESSSFLSPSVSIAVFCMIESKCFIVINYTIINNLKITDNVRIDAGYLVTKDINISGIYYVHPFKISK